MIRIGIDLGGSKIEGIAVDEAGVELVRHRVPTPKEGYEAVLGAVGQVVGHIEAGAGRVERVGIGTPGSISPHDGVMQNCNTILLKGRSLRADLEERLERRVRLANDADCFALSEATDGAGQGFDSVFGVILGTGTGGGFVFRGSLLEGPNAIAGEWGHNPLPWLKEAEFPGPLCTCGKRGCIETFLSGPGLSQAHLYATGQELEAVDIAAAAALGEAKATETMALYCDRLARALAMLINIVDPGVIVLGGGVSNVDLLYERVPQLLPSYVFATAVSTPLRKAVHGDSSGVRGAAWLWHA